MGSSVNIPDMSANLKAKVTGGRRCLAGHLAPQCSFTAPPSASLAARNAARRRRRARCHAAPPARPSAAAVSEQQQSDPRLLAAVYDDMAQKFEGHGLTLPAVEAMRQYFENLEGPGEDGSASARTAVAA